jgi:hypothetical protein
MSFFFNQPQNPFFVPSKTASHPFSPFGDFPFGAFMGGHPHSHCFTDCRAKNAENAENIPKRVAEHHVEQLPDGTIIFRPIYRQGNEKSETERQEAIKKAKIAQEEAERFQHQRNIQQFLEQQRLLEIQHQQELKRREEELKQQEAVQEFFSSLLGSFFGHNVQKKEPNVEQNVEKVEADANHVEQTEPTVEEPSSGCDEEAIFADLFSNPFDFFHPHQFGRKRCHRRQKRHCKPEQCEKPSKCASKCDQNEKIDQNDQNDQFNIGTELFKKTIHIPDGSNFLDVLFQALFDENKQDEKKNEQNDEQKPQPEPQPEPQTPDPQSSPVEETPVRNETFETVVAPIAEPAEVVIAPVVEEVIEITPPVIEEVIFEATNQAVTEPELIEEVIIEDNSPVVQNNDNTPQNVETVEEIAQNVEVAQHIQSNVETEEQIKPVPAPEAVPNIEPTKTAEQPVESVESVTDAINQDLLSNLFKQTEELYKKRTILLTKIKNPQFANKITFLQTALKQIDRLIEQTHQYTQELLDEGEDDFQLVHGELESP